MSEGWKSDVTPLMRRISQVATGAGSLFLLVAGSRLALALPADRKAARIVADLYQPQRCKGRLFLGIAKWMITFGIPGFRPTYLGTVGSIPEVTWLKEAAERGCIGFLGCNPNHGPRCVLAGIEPSSGEKFIAKLGLDESAHAIRREAKVLENLKGCYPGVITPMELKTPSLQSQVASEQTFDWALLRLPYLGNSAPKSMDDAEVHKLLGEWLGGDSKPLSEFPWAAQLLERVAADEAPTGWHDAMKCRRIRTTLLHGDFAVWNLRKTLDGLMAIDWEWGVENAVAGIDLAHGLRQEFYMARGMKPEAAVANILKLAASSRWSGYLNMCGWSNDLEDWLRLGLLHSHFNALNPSAELLKVLDIHLNS